MAEALRAMDLESSGLTVDALGDFLDDLGLLLDESGEEGTEDRPVASIRIDSRAVTPGDVFVALRGTKVDGHSFLTQAAAQGAALLLVESEIPVGLPCPVCRVADTHQIFALLSALIAKFPSKEMTVAGVTGTNGKTTVAFLMEAMWQGLGFSTGLSGTVVSRYSGFAAESALTTPDAFAWQSLLAAMKRAGATHVVAEVSSHALAQKRVDMTEFDVAVFTNLTRDHLDFHSDLDSYFQAKSRLFLELLRRSPKKHRSAVINIDDPYGQKLAKQVAGDVLRFSLNNPKAEYFLEGWRGSRSGWQALLHSPFGKTTLRSSMLGRHNASNLLAALAAVCRTSTDLEALLPLLPAMVGAPGRLQAVPNHQEKTVLVDYAHTPDALRNVLEALRPLVEPGAKLICLFGCGGDRDRGKRPLMASTAAELSDQVVLTSDNPRTEDPQRILNDAKAGFPASFSKYAIEADRKTAIETAIHGMRPKDILLIAGKGHENYQIVGTTKRDFDDVKVASEALRT